MPLDPHLIWNNGIRVRGFRVAPEYLAYITNWVLERTFFTRDDMIQELKRVGVPADPVATPSLVQYKTADRIIRRLQRRGLIERIGETPRWQKTSIGGLPLQS
jgi:hypothetical protein